MTLRNGIREFDAIVIGAGFSGLSMLHSLRATGLSVRVFEQGSEIADARCSNRFPGARRDIQFSAQVIRAAYDDVANRWHITTQDGRTTSAQFLITAVGTGFDAMTGALFSLGITGRDGQALADKRATGPGTYRGLTTHGFPNLFMISGPLGSSVLSSMPGAIEQNVEWVAGLIRHMREHGQEIAEADEADGRGAQMAGQGYQGLTLTRSG